MRYKNGYVDVFSKYYGFEKLDKSNPFYQLKASNYEAVKSAYKNKMVSIDTHPIRATIETTDHCNLNCIMCQIHSQTSNHKLQSMSKQDFDKIYPELFPYLVELHPTNIGEPLMSPWFDYLCEKVKEYGVLLDITSNGMLWTEEKIQRVLPLLLDIKISFDGMKKETLERIRRGADYSTIRKNIDSFVRLRKEFGAKGTLTLQMTLLDINFHELIDVIHFAAEKGIDRVKAYHVFSYSDKIDKHSLFRDLELFEGIRTEAINLSEELGVYLEISEPISTGGKAPLICQHCRLPWSEIFVDYDTSVYPCHSHEGKAYGNMLSQTWTNIWNGDYAKELRFSLTKQSEKTICTNCGMNFIKYDENQSVPHDIEGYLSRSTTIDTPGEIRWSSRSRQFSLNR